MMFAVTGQFIDAIDQVEEGVMEDTDMLIRSWGGDDEHDYMDIIAENTLVIRKLQALSFHAKEALDNGKRTLEWDGLDWYINWHLLKSPCDEYYLQDHIIPNSVVKSISGVLIDAQRMADKEGGQQ